MSRRSLTPSVQWMECAAAAALVAVAVVLAAVPPEGAGKPAPLRHEATAPAPRAPHARDDDLWVVRLVPAHAAREARPGPPPLDMVPAAG